MKKIQMGIWSADPDYGGRVSAYIRTTEYRERIAPVIFTDRESCMFRVEDRDSSLDILLVDDELLDEEQLQGIHDAGCGVVALCENAAEPQCSGSYHQLKYQPLNRLLDAVIQACTAGAYDGRVENRQRSFVMAVYSAVGGAGKTTFAYTAGSLLARMGYRPAILTLESVPSPCWRVNSTEDNFGRALYEAIKAPEDKPANLDSWFIEEPARKIRYLPAALNDEELEHMGEAEAVRLIDAAALSARSDILILDLDSGLFPRTIASLKNCDKTVFLIPPCTIGIEKSRLLLKQMEARYGQELPRSISLILNMSERPANGTLSFAGHEVEEILPFQNEWRELPSIEAWNARSFYQERLFYWLTGLMKQHKRMPGGGDRI
jgi:MinD-like ATPase involved in chromosome partitioning or flagellar assembly